MSGKADSGIRLDWPGRPSAFLPPVPPDLAPLVIAERWPGGSHGAESLLIAGDATAVLDAWRGGDALLTAQGPVQLVYLDPPFATGTTFAADIPIGERRASQRSVRLPAYRDVWPGGLAGYLTFMARLLARLRDVLADDGWLCLHCDHRTNAHLRLILDELFGPDGFRNEIVWSYGLGNGTSRRGFPRKHDTLLLYAKRATAVFTPIRGAVSPAMANKYRHVRPDGTRFMRSYGREYDLKGGKPVGSVWDIPSVAPTSGERTGYPTQKPRALLERLLAATTAPGDTVLDPCCGSGTTLIAASGLGRRSVGIDASWLAIATARARLDAAGGSVTFADVHPHDQQRRAEGPVDSSGPEGPDSPAGPTGSASGSGGLREDRPPLLLTATTAVVIRSAYSGEDDLLPSPGGEEARRTEPGRSRGRGLPDGSGASNAPRSDAEPTTTGLPVGGDPTGPSRQFDLTATARRTTEAGPDGTTDALSITLHGLAVTSPEASDPDRSPFAIRDNQLVRLDPAPTPLTDHWSDWLTGWAVHLGRRCGQPETPFVAVASSHRTGRMRSLLTTLSLPGSGSDGQWPEQIMVRLYDLFGGWSDHVVPIAHDRSPTRDRPRGTDIR